MDIFHSRQNNFTSQITTGKLERKPICCFPDMTSIIHVKNVGEEEVIRIMVCRKYNEVNI